MSSVEKLTWAWVDFCSNPWAVRQEVTTSDVVSVALSQKQAALHCKERCFANCMRYKG